jgi:hypothetical protein
VIGEREVTRTEVRLAAEPSGIFGCWRIDLQVAIVLRDGSPFLILSTNESSLDEASA